MKKLSLLVGGLVLSTMAMAQKPDASTPMSLEGQTGLMSGAAGGTNFGFTAPSVRFRYFIADNLAIRATVMMNNSNMEKTLYEGPGISGATGTATAKNTGYGIGIGAEYHFTGTDKLSPYAGLDIQFGGGNAHTEGSNTNDGLTYTANDSYKSDAKTSMFGVKLAAGTDYYFAENFYLGLELGLLWSSNNVKVGTGSATTGGTTVSGNTSPASKSSSLSTNTAGMFRLGWRF
jgi:outer membrane protein W